MALGKRSLGIRCILNAWLAVAILARLAFQYLRLYRGTMIFLFGPIFPLVEVVMFRIFLHAVCQSPLQHDKKLGLARRASLLEALDVCTRARQVADARVDKVKGGNVNCCAPLYGYAGGKRV